MNCKITSLASGRIGGRQDMGNNQYVLVLLTVLCILEGLVFIELRRLRMGKGPK